MSMIDSGGGMFGSGSGLGDLSGQGDNMASLGPLAPTMGGGPLVDQIVNTSVQDESVRLYLGGRFNRVSYTAVAHDDAYPTVTVALEFSMDGTNWFAPAVAVELAAAGIKAGNDSTGFLWARVRVKTKSASGDEYIRIILSATNTTA
jgi:hypothetical protein